MDDQPATRYFVTVATDGRRGMRAVSAQGLDLFAPTATATETGAAVDGHLTLTEIGRLVDQGHTVTVHGAVEAPPLELAASVADWSATHGLDLPGIEEFEEGRS